MTQTHTYNPVTEEVLAALRAALGEEFVKMIRKRWNVIKLTKNRIRTIITCRK